MSLKKDYTELYSHLNKEQKVAVDTIDGPVLVLAGPGTGKTQVLTMRIANILKNTDTPPDAILALTFTESGVKAMRERLISIIGQPAYYVNIYTFHSFASDVIKSNPDEFIVSTQLEPLSDLERIFIFQEIIDSLELKALKSFTAKYYYLKAMISKITTLKREGISPSEYIDYVMKANLEEKDLAKNIELKSIYEMYEVKLREHGRYDFEDMINFVLEKFDSSPELLSKYQERFHYFLVDEFQDTNSSQAELLYKLTAYWGDAANIFVVGDDDQSIYRFQGASTENIINFTDKYPNATKVALKVNYRSTQDILDSSLALIKHNKLRLENKIGVDKSQVANLKSDSKTKAIEYGSFSSSFTENHFIALKIKELINNGVSPGDIAIIYRNNADSIDISDMLARHKIPYSLEGGEDILNSGIIVKLLHLMSAILNIEDKTEDIDLFTLLNYEFLEIKPLDVLKLSRFATLKKINFFDVFLHPEYKTIQLEDRDKINDFYQKLVEWKQLSLNVPFIEFLETIIDESNYINWILQRPNSFELLNIVNSFISEVKHLNQSNRLLSLKSFLKYIDLMKENHIIMPERVRALDESSVRLMTAHKSKGLEFEYVFIPKFVDKKWSNTINRELIKLPLSILKTLASVTKEEEKKRQEEDDRRLFFVALTRAKRHLFITNANKYMQNGSERDAVVSMFLSELTEDNFDLIDISKYEKGASELLSSLLKPINGSDYISLDEKRFLRDALKNFKLSPSSLNNYLNCPYKFKLDVLFKTPEPQPVYFILGTAIHKALEESAKRLKKGLPVEFSFLENEFIKALDKEIISKDTYKDVKKEGVQILKAYYLKYESEFNDVKGAQKIVFLEKYFGYGWNKPMLDGTIPLSGKTDKVVRISPKEVKIVDYKTGRPKSRNQILGLTKDAKADQYRQLLFYKLLIELDRSLNLKVSEVELDFIGSTKVKPKRESFVITDDEMFKIKETIRKVASNIANLKFNRTEDTSNCLKCRFKDHCWPDGIKELPDEQISLKI